MEWIDNLILPAQGIFKTWRSREYFESALQNQAGRQAYGMSKGKGKGKDKSKGKGKDKGKAIPLQAWTGPEGSSRLRLPDFKTIGT
jgi:hypothetical protein